LFCWHAVTCTDSDHGDGVANIYVYSDGHCNTAVPSLITSTDAPLDESTANGAAAGLFAAARGWDWLLGDPVAVSRASTAQADAGGSGAIIDVLSSIGVVCPWYAYPNDTARCNSYNIRSDANWTIDNVSHDVRDFAVTHPIGTDDPKEPVATGSISIPASSGKGMVSVSEAVSTVETTSTATQHGGKVGARLGFKQTVKTGIPFFVDGKVELTQEISAEYSWGDTETNSTTKSDTRTVSISAEAEPGFTTTLDVFTVKRTANYDYRADLDLGKDATVQPVDTPATVALNQSPSYRQPCLEYAISNFGARSSLSDIGYSLLSAGYSPTEPTLTPEGRAFLSSFRNIGALGAPCPGFPLGYASQTDFHGDGVGTYDNLGYDEQGNPVKMMTGCVYETSYPPKGASDALLHSRLEAPDTSPADDSNPCQQVAVDGGAVRSETPGLLINDRNAPAGSARRADGFG
jgi:hypothetical protein